MQVQRVGVVGLFEQALAKDDLGGFEVVRFERLPARARSWIGGANRGSDSLAAGNSSSRRCRRAGEQPVSGRVQGIAAKQLAQLLHRALGIGRDQLFELRQR